MRAVGCAAFIYLGLGGLAGVDEQIRAWMPAQKSQLAIWSSHFGDNLAYLISAIWGIYLLRNDRRGWWMFVLLLVGQHVLVNSSKALFHTLRPEQAGQIGGYAYPSGHTGMAACLYGALSRYHKLWLVLPVLVAWARVALGHHWFTDVLGGLLLGWLWVDAWTALDRRWRGQGHQPGD